MTTPIPVPPGHEIVEVARPDRFDLVSLRPGSSMAQYLLELGYIDPDTPVLPRATAADVRGRHVLGVLPPHLAALCASVTVLEIDLSGVARGADLTIPRIHVLARGLRTYVVREAASPVGTDGDETRTGYQP